MGGLCVSKTEKPRPSIIALSSGVAAIKKSSMDVENTTVEICIGDIFLENTQALINPTDTEFSDRNKFSEILYFKAGPTIKNEITKHMDTKKENVQVGYIITTTGGLMKFKNILHFASPIYISGENREKLALTKVIIEIFELLDKLKITTASLPLLGVTSGGFPIDISSKIFCDCLYFYFRQHPDSNIKLLRVVTENEAQVDALAEQIWDTREDATENPGNEYIEIDEAHRFSQETKRIDVEIHLNHEHTNTHYNNQDNSHEKHKYSEKRSAAHENNHQQQHEAPEVSIEKQDNSSERSGSQYENIDPLVYDNKNDEPNIELEKQTRKSSDKDIIIDNNIQKDSSNDKEYNENEENTRNELEEVKSENEHNAVKHIKEIIHEKIEAVKEHISENNNEEEDSNKLATEASEQIDENSSNNNAEQINIYNYSIEKNFYVRKF